VRVATVAGAVLTLSGDTDQKNRKRKRVYVTYTRVDPETGQVYSGRTSGFGDPAELILNRSKGGQPHPELTANGFGPPVIDAWSFDRYAIRGREQMLIDFHGGAQSVGGISANKINGIADFNPNRPEYMRRSRAAFGDLPDNSPARMKLDWWK
jgi:hypothetical protein